MKDLGIEGLQTVFKSVAVSCDALEIDFYIIGATAKNFWLAKGGKAPEGTKDIDFAVYVATAQAYHELRLKLINDCNYANSEDNAFRLISPSGMEIDLLPFGEIEVNGTVQVSGVGLVDINLAGFQEVYEAGQQSIEINGNEYLTCSIASVVILKLIAYDDRPERRIKDIRDIASILKHYPDLEMELIWEDHNDLYELGFEHEQIGLIVLGREMNKIITTNITLFDRIKRILENATAPNSKIPELMIIDLEKETLQQQIQKIKYLLRGLNDRLKP